LPLAQAPERTLVPRAALTRRDGKLAVFVLERLEPSPAGHGELPRAGELERRVAALREVRVGAYGDDAVEILSGVSPGEVVAISTQHALADAVPVEFEALPLAGPLARALPQ